MFICILTHGQKTKRECHHGLWICHILKGRWLGSEWEKQNVEYTNCPNIMERYEHRKRDALKETPKILPLKKKKRYGHDRKKSWKMWTMYPSRTCTGQMKHWLVAYLNFQELIQELGFLVGFTHLAEHADPFPTCQVE